MEYNNLVGKIHSIDSLGTVDGPGIRYIVFMQGCKMRCLYCHNPDSWSLQEGKQRTVDEMFTEIIKSKRYMDASKGGLTVSGGEPLLQAEFVIELFKKTKAAGVHNCLDTNGFIDEDSPLLEELFDNVDLVMLDIKHLDDILHKKLTGRSIRKPKHFAEKLKQHGIRTWFRQVVVPNWHDNTDYMKQLIEYAKNFDNLEYIELLPFHKLGEFKWNEMELTYKLKDTPAPQKDIMQEYKEMIEAAGIKVRL